MPSKFYSERPDLFTERKPLLTRREVCALVGVSQPGLLKWERTRKLVPVAKTPRGGPLFSFEALAKVLRSAIGMGLVPALVARRR